ncbi:hypothetical protein PSY73_23575, partial [Shigella flexneri]|nr:hypothetical protein [Shigella flexneri]
MKKSQEKIQELWKNYKRYKRTTRRSEKGAKEIFEVIMATNFTKLMRDQSDKISRDHSTVLLITE